MLTHWTRDRTRGDRLPLEWMVKKQTHDTARLYGLTDRGTIEVGAVADINLIDYDHLQMGNPTVVNDLPAGGSRLLQGATGYVETIKSGVTTFADGEETGARPGTLAAGRPLTGLRSGPGRSGGSRVDRAAGLSTASRGRRRPPARIGPGVGDPDASAAHSACICWYTRCSMMKASVGTKPAATTSENPPQPPVGPTGQVGRGHQVDQVEVPVDRSHDLLGHVHLGPDGLEDDHDEQADEGGAHDERHHPVADQGADHAPLYEAGQRRRAQGPGVGRGAGHRGCGPASAAFELGQVPVVLGQLGSLLGCLRREPLPSGPGLVRRPPSWRRWPRSSRRPPLRAQPGWSWPSADSALRWPTRRGCGG